MTESDHRPYRTRTGILFATAFAAGWIPATSAGMTRERVAYFSTTYLG